MELSGHTRVMTSASTSRRGGGLEEGEEFSWVNIVANGSNVGVR